jgi:NAD(P)-dependent dehydrogenase (short-subunit alcohol dehydrogenase family)
MRAAGFGRIVNIASVAALGKRDRTAYSASKAALCGMTRTWALELGRDGITVNAIAPGAIDTSAFRSANPASGKPSGTDRIPVGRLGTPDDVAHAASFLLSARAGFVSGQVLYVCGGSTIGAAR